MVDGLRIVLFEDRDDVTSSLEVLLNQNGWEKWIFRAVQTHPGIAFLKSQPADLILFDLRMLTEVQSPADLPWCQVNLPFILITEQLEEAAIIHWMQQGAVDVISYANLNRLPQSLDQIKQKSLSALRLNKPQTYEMTTIESQDGMLVLGLDLVIQYANPTAQRWFSAVSPIEGERVDELFSKVNIPSQFILNIDQIKPGEIIRQIVEVRDEQNQVTAALEISHFLRVAFSEREQSSVVQRLGYIEMIRDITQRKKAEGLALQLNIKLKAIAESARKMTSLLDQEALCEQVVVSLMDIMHAYAISLYYLEDDMLTLKAARSAQDAHPISLGGRLDLQRGILAYVVRSGRALLVPDVTLEPRYRAYEGLPATRAEMAVPIRSGDRILGVLDVQDRNAFSLDDSDLEILGIWADQLAVAIENAQLFQQIRRRTQELEAIATVSAALRQATNRTEMMPIIAENLMRLLESPDVCVLGIEAASGMQLVEYATGRWMHLMQQRTLFLLKNERSGDTSDRFAQPGLVEAQLKKGNQAMFTQVAPMMVQGLSVGEIWVGRETAFRKEDIRMIEAVVAIAANALHRATLHDQTQTRLRRISALQKIDLTIATSFDLSLVFNVLISEVISQLGVDAVSILVLNPHLNVLEYAAGQGFRNSNVQKTRIRLGESYAGRIALERRSIHFERLEEVENPAFVRALVDEGLVSYFGVPLQVKGQIKGVLEVFSRKPFTPDEEWVNFLNTLAGQAAIAVENTSMFENLQRNNIDLTLAYDATIEGWSRALDLRDEDTEGHTKRVTEMTMRLCDALGVSEMDKVHIRRGALLHDIGKMAIPDRILLKPGSLTDEEWKIMRLHPIYANDFLSSVSFLRPALSIPYCHHERWDGQGYPRGLQGDQIPMAARIFSIADVWDALTSQRPYREPWPQDKAVEYISSEAGKSFDPQIVQAFKSMFTERARMPGLSASYNTRS
ncbi:MAG: HD domain-containing phosphohydrolase [Clostridiaceae bacterium]